MAAVSERLIHGAGTQEAAWRAAPWLEEAPSAGLDELVPAASRLLVVAPHPDDEVLGCGGLIHDAVAAGRQVCVVALTDGEHAYPHEPAWPPARLARTRRAELRDALAALGAGDVEVRHLALGDGALAERHADTVRALAALCGPRDVFCVTWARDGHPDHEAAARAAHEVARRQGIPVFEYPIWGWHWADAAHSPFGDSLLRYELDARTRECKAAAMRRFATQTGEVAPAPAAPILPPAVLQRFQRPFEIYLRT
ncbi:PIG-L family deacetylase [Stenotrophomonas sp. HITSZ_GD]|uniref:PIG-L deacetylase family protein n=1 Tax=Stenotrophomonas sp. HITSZ_GD TaxID=3037248 RepID=UPI00240E4093|nr:PIG-L family deacetylase [Stenotrophomonas sp. HITSZ_GD]MDG2525932.1 PIG-L family deacetylase [Stenotrophomonas sp. HITSZ_GD]